LRLIFYTLAIGGFLTGVSYLYSLTPITYNSLDEDFAHMYAQEMLAHMDTIEREAHINGQKAGNVCNYFLEMQDDFYQRKYAATHFKRAVAEDFVYAFDLAEAWCKYAADAAYDPGNETAKRLARERSTKAQAEFLTITKKHYTQ
jgi:hypothetical protein